MPESSSNTGVPDASLGEARAFWVEGPGKGAIRTMALSPLEARGDDGRDGEPVVLSALYSGISRGTESLVFRGDVPRSLAAIMRCPFQEGAFPGPVKYGYNLVARVAEGPPSLLGKTVFCLHPHQDRAVVPEAAVIPVPDAIPPRRAVLAANMETAINAVWDSPLTCGSRVVIVGCGLVGSLIAHVASRFPAIDLTVIDTDPVRAAWAEAHGAAFATPRDTIGGADIVFHASGTAAGLDTALAAAGFEATIIEASWFGATPVAASFGAGFHPLRLTYRSSQVGSIAPAMRPRWTHRDRLALALSMLDDPRLDSLLGTPIPFEDLPRRMPDIVAGHPTGGPCPVVAYDPAA